MSIRFPLGQHSEQRLLLVHPGTWGTGPVTSGWWVGSEVTASITQPDRHTLFLPSAGGRYYPDGGLLVQGGSGYYWTTRDGPTGGYNLYLMRTVVNPMNHSTRNYGFSVRCVAGF